MYFIYLFFFGCLTEVLKEGRWSGRRRQQSTRGCISNHRNTPNKMYSPTRPIRSA